MNTVTSALIFLVGIKYSRKSEGGKKGQVKSETAVQIWAVAGEEGALEEIVSK